MDLACRAPGIGFPCCVNNEQHWSDVEAEQCVSKLNISLRNQSEKGNCCTTLQIPGWELLPLRTPLYPGYGRGLPFYCSVRHSAREDLSRYSASVTLPTGECPGRCASYCLTVLINPAYKMLAKALAIRPEGILPTLDHPNQMDLIKRCQAANNTEQS